MNLIDFFSHPVFFASGMALVHSLWQILLIAVIWRIVIYITRNFPADVRYYASLISFLSIPLTFIITFSRQLSVYNVADPAIQGNNSDIIRLIRQSENMMLPLQETDPGFTRYVEIYSPLIFWLYLVVVIFLSWKSLLGYADVRSLQTNGTSSLPGAWMSRLKELMQIAGLTKRVTVLLSYGVSVPMVTGIIKPVILLPLAIFSSLQIHQVEAILLHELYHVRKHDHFINTIQNFIEILFFFHPATWWISKNLRSEREKRTDEWVVSVTHEPLVYARALVILETGRHEKHEAAVAAVRSKNELLTRIKNIMTMKSNKTNTGRKAAAMMVLSVAIISVAWFNPLKIDVSPNHEIINPDGFSNVPESAQVNDEIAKTVNKPQEKPATDTTNQGPEVNEPEEAPESGEIEEAKEIMQENKANEYQEISDPELSEEIRQQVEKAREAVKEAMEQINSEEFKNEMRQAREEIRKAMEEFNSDEFKEEMRQAREEMKRAMQEINSEEFRQEMKQAQEEIRQAMQEINSEEFKMQMQLAGEQMKKAMEDINSEEFQEQMRQAGEQMNRALQEIDSEEFREQMRQVQQRIKEAAREIEKEQLEEQP